MKNLKYYILLLILHSSFLIPNCFTQWLQQTLPVNKPITGIEFVDTLRGWACTGWGTQNDSSYILYTTNSGTNWLVQLSVYNTFFTDIDMLNSLTGYVAGHDFNIARGKLFSTTNGGVNWTSITLIQNMDIDDMQFLNEDSAWECSGLIGPDVRTTTDGGNTWEVRTTGITQPTSRLFFLNYNTGFCAAQNNLHKTTNAGQNWFPIGSFSQGVQSIYFLNVITGWVGLSLNRMYYTSNGGINWIVQTLPPNSNSTVLDLFFLNSITGYAGTGFNKIFKTTDGGLNWGYQLDTGGSYRISIINETNGWSSWIGTNIGIKHTTNGGGPIFYTGFISSNNEVPKKFMLSQNYPNPFNPITTIKLDLPVSSNVKLIICDMLGKELYEITNQYLKAGSYSFVWDAIKYSSGIYFYRLSTDKFADTKKMILIK